MMSNKSTLIVAAMTFITVMVWVMADILHSRTQVKIPPQVEKLIEPIAPTLDTQIIDQF